MRLSTHLPLAVVALAAAVQAERMTMEEFGAGKPLPVTFTSAKVAWLKMRNPVVDEDIQIIAAINNEDRSTLRSLVACPICNKCMHSSTLVTTKCGHGFHEECFSEHVAENGEICPTCRNRGPHTDLWKRTVLREALGIFDDGSWIPANPGQSEGGMTASEYSGLNSLKVDFTSNEIIWLGKQKTVFETDKQIISAIKDEDPVILRDLTNCPICTDCMHSTTMMSTKCGHAFHARCFEEYSNGGTEIPCPLCRDSGPHDNYWRGTLFKDALRLFKDNGWIPKNPGAFITLGEFRDEKMPLPIDFSSAHLHLLAGRKPMMLPDEQLIGLIKDKHPDHLRDLVQCPVCSQPMHSDTLGVTKCFHLVHRDCLSVYIDNIGDMCPVCNTAAPFRHGPENFPLKSALELFEQEHWIPPKRVRMTREQFTIRKSLPIDFESPGIKWLVTLDVRFESEKKLLEAIKTKNREGIRDAVACPICKKCIHSASLKMAACGHAFHDECVVTCRSKSDREECACPVCSARLTRKSDITAGTRITFKEALYLFEVEGWIPARGKTGISAEELARLAPFRRQNEGFAPPQNWLRGLLPPGRSQLPAEGDTTREYRYFVRKRFLVHIVVFLRVMNEVASALAVCGKNSIVESIVNDDKKGRAVALGVCYLPRSELKSLNDEFFKSIKTDGLFNVFVSYGGPIKKIAKTNGKLVIYTGNEGQPKMISQLMSSKNRGLLFQKMLDVRARFEYVQPYEQRYNIPEVDVASAMPSLATISKEMFFSAVPVPNDKHVPKTMATWLKKIATENGPVKSALEEGVRLIFEDARLDWMRKAAEWLQNMDTVTSELLKATIAIRSKNMNNLEQHNKDLLELISKPVLEPSDLKSWKQKLWMKETDMGNSPKEKDDLGSQSRSARFFGIPVRNHRTDDVMFP